MYSLLYDQHDSYFHILADWSSYCKYVKLYTYIYITFKYKKMCCIVLFYRTAKCRQESRGVRGGGMGRDPSQTQTWVAEPTTLMHVHVHHKYDIK